MQAQNVKRSIYILPNLFTSMNLFCGNYSITAAVQSKFVDAAMTVSVVLFFSRLGINPESYKVVLLVLMFGLSFCMVSSFRYKSCKKVSFFKSMKFNKLVGLILVLVAVAAEPYIFLFGVFLLYVVSGPVLSMLYHQISKNGKKPQTDKGF